jgi:hypothetical protein
VTLSQKQAIFSVLVAKLILHAHSLGYGLTLGECYRSPEEAERLATIGKGIKTSLHTKRLAIDLNLFIRGVYQADSGAYKPLGEWWEAQSTDAYECAWGGRFGDGNHFALAHGGRK